MGASVGQVGPGEVMVAQTELRAGGMGLWSIIAQAVTHIAPAMGFLTGATFIAANSGTGVSLAYFAAFLVCMAIGLTIIPLARYLPSAGGYFTYVSRTLHPRLGFLTAWLYFLYDPTAVAINFTILGFIWQNQLSERRGHLRHVLRLSRSSDLGPDDARLGWSRDRHPSGFRSERHH